jgi:hypothetical protein
MKKPSKSVRQKTAAVAKDYQTSVASRTEDRRYEGKPDDALFVLSTTSSVRTRRKLKPKKEEVNKDSSEASFKKALKSSKCLQVGFIMTLVMNWFRKLKQMFAFYITDEDQERAG